MKDSDKYGIELTDEQWGLVVDVLYHQRTLLHGAEEIMEAIMAGHRKQQQSNSKAPVSSNITATIHISTNDAVDLAEIIDVLNEKNISAKFA